MDSITIRAPDDFHVHVRQGDLLAPMVRATARYFKRALIMPNTDPPILTGETAGEYQDDIISVSPPGFQPLMTIKIVPQTTTYQIRFAYSKGIVAGKLYPDGVTTGSANGVRDFKALAPVFSAMEEVGLVLCLHGEDPGKDVFCLDREERFLETLQWILQEFPGLKVVMEHLSTAAAADFVRQYGQDNLAATVTAHHLDITLDDVIGGKLMPHHFCKPVAKRPEDRELLIQAVTEPGQTRFFLGTDSAPHLRGDKECDCGAAGVFTAPLALPLVAEIFEREDALPQMEAFTSVNGANFYGLPLNEGTITLVREEWTVPEQYDGVAPLRAGKTIRWKVKEDCNSV
jgi:dihydroorotase